MLKVRRCYTRPVNEVHEHTASWRKIVRVFGILFVTAFVVGVASYWLLHSVLGQRHVFGSLFRMFLYHDQHPEQYIAVVAFFYAVLAATWGVRTRSVGWRWHFSLFSVLVATLLLSSAVCGVLYFVHDMQAGYFPPWERRIGVFANGVVTGITLGWLIVLLSFPFNVITTLLAYAATYYLLQPSRNA